MGRQRLIEVREGTAAQWASANPTLAAGEPGWDTTNGVFKIGDGVTDWAGLAAVGAGGLAPQVPRVPGYWYPAWPSAVGTTLVLPDGVEMAVPFPGAGPVPNVGLRIQTASTGFLRFGIRTMLANGQPGPPLGGADFGTVVATAIGFVGRPAGVTVPASWFLCVAAQGGTPTVTQMNQLPNTVGMVDPLSTSYGAWSMSGVTGAFPTVFVPDAVDRIAPRVLVQAS